jgi:hypothetical protein
VRVSLIFHSDDWCGRPGSNRHSSFEPRDFLTSYGFRRLAWARSRFWLVCGLDYTFTVARSRFRCCSSSLYTFAPAVQLERLARDCLLPVSPNLGSSAPSVSRRALNLLKSLASTNFATPACLIPIAFSQAALKCFPDLPYLFSEGQPCSRPSGSRAKAVSHPTSLLAGL